MASFVKVFVAFSAYAAIHSLLLSSHVRLFLEAAFGQRAFRGVFRLFYSIQAVVLFLVFLGYAASLPDIDLLVFEGDLVWMLLLLRLLGLAIIAWCLWSLGFRRFLGWENWKAWRRGELAAGNGLDFGEFVASGPYRFVRHPMYTGGLLVLWAVPHWTLNILAFALAASLYLWIGALLEEKRLVKAYGDAYRRYQERTPKYFPGVGGKGR